MVLFRFTQWMVTSPQEFVVVYSKTQTSGDLGRGCSVFGRDDDDDE